MAISIPDELKPEIIEIDMRERFIAPATIPLLSRGAQPKSGVESEMTIQILTFLKERTPLFEGLLYAKLDIIVVNGGIYPQ